MQEAEVLVQIDLTKLSETQREKLEEIEAIFRDLGIHFDTGSDGGSRDWEWDWSLIGPIKVYFKKFKDGEIVDAVCDPG
jgi:hypothetical protein